MQRKLIGCFYTATETLLLQIFPLKYHFHVALQTNLFSSHQYAYVVAWEAHRLTVYDVSLYR